MADRRLEAMLSEFGVQLDAGLQFRDEGSARD